MSVASIALLQQTGFLRALQPARYGGLELRVGDFAPLIVDLAEACRIVVHDKLAPVGGEGGLIAVDAAGQLALPFNSAGMYRASRDAAGQELVAIY